MFVKVAQHASDWLSRSAGEMLEVLYSLARSTSATKNDGTRSNNDEQFLIITRGVCNSRDIWWATANFPIRRATFPSQYDAQC